MDLSIVIVSWNVREKLRENLRAIYKSAGDFSFEIIIVDNNSKDKTAEMIKKDFPQASLIINKENLGFSKANNQAFKIAKGDFILMLNPDMLVRADTLKNILGWMKANPQAGIASCKLINDKGEVIKHVRRFPRLSDQLAIILKLPHFFPNLLKKYIREDFNYEKEARVDSVRGGFMLIRKDVIEKIGMLDERFFIWFEEVDFCKRLKNSGGEVWYTPVATCVDYIGQSFKRVETMKKQLYFRDSMLKYFKKWHPAWQYRVLQIAWLFGLIITYLGGLINYNKKANT